MNRDTQPNIGRRFAGPPETMEEVQKMLARRREIEDRSLIRFGKKEAGLPAHEAERIIAQARQRGLTTPAHIEGVLLWRRPMKVTVRVTQENPEPKTVRVMVRYPSAEGEEPTTGETR